MDLNTCYATTFEVRQLALYSHLLPILTSLILGLFAYRFAKSKVRSVLFLLFTITLSLWLIGDLFTWHSNNYYQVAAYWSILDFINILFYIVLVCFFYVDFKRAEKLPYWVTLISALVITFPFLITFTGLSVGEFDEANCEMVGNSILAQYKLLIELCSIVIISILGTINLVRFWALRVERNRTIVITLATIIFLTIFSGSEYIATFTNVYEITLYALFALPIFILVLTYALIENNNFNFKVKNLTFVRLLFGIFLLVGTFNLFLTDDTLEFFVTAASSIVTLGFGLLLFRGAGREAKQLEEIQTLAANLKRVNTRLEQLDKLKSEFVSIASHQLRSPLAAIMGYSSMLTDGSYGKLPAKAQEIALRIEQSSRLMGTSVEDYLNVSRIEAGHMKYNLSDFNIKEQAERVSDDIRPSALKRNIILLFRTNMESKGIVHADIGKTEQILHNLINNSLKYTKQGNITIIVRDDMKLKKLYIDITDTGIGMNEKTIGSIFQKFERGSNANTTNIHGTGLGLFTATKLAEAMGASITAHSDGEGKGSRFTIEFPIVA